MKDQHDVQSQIDRQRSGLLRRVGRRARAENGGTLVETAFTLLVLLASVVGVIEMSWAMYSYHYIADAAREGTRYAIVRGADWPSSCSSYTASGCNASPANIQAFVANLGIGPIGINPSNASNYIFVCYNPSSTAACTTSSTSNVPAAENSAGNGNVVQVTITYPFSFGIPSFGNPGVLSYTYNLTSSSQMVIAQ